MSLTYMTFYVLLLWIAKCNTEVIDCGFPGTFNEMTLNGTDDTWTNVTYKPGTLVIYECFQGFRLRNGNNRTCQNNGQWSATIPWCDRNIALNAYAANWEGNEMSFITDGLTKENGKPGYCMPLQSNKLIEVHLDDNYIIHQVEIYVQEAIDRENIEGDTVTVLHQGLCHRENFTNRDGKRISYVCNTTNNSFNETEATKIELFHEKGKPGVCEIEVYGQQNASNCRYPEIPSNGNVSIYLNEEDGYLVASYQCLDGYELNGPKQRKCNGIEWSNDQPICRKTSEQLSASTTGIVVIVIVVMIIVGIILAIVVYKRKSWRKVLPNFVSGNCCVEKPHKYSEVQLKIQSNNEDLAGNHFE